MPWWSQLLRMFTHDEQLIKKLSESGPMRYAARMTVYWFMQAKQKGFDKLSKPDPNAASENATGLKSFTERFRNELHKGIKELENEKKRKP